MRLGGRRSPCTQPSSWIAVTADTKGEVSLNVPGRMGFPKGDRTRLSPDEECRVGMFGTLASLKTSYASFSAASTGSSAGNREGWRTWCSADRPDLTARLGGIDTGVDTAKDGLLVEREAAEAERGEAARPRGGGSRVATAVWRAT